ncbi:MAG: hypothetical protein AAFY60_21445, partial [Myxococcota bacterium]
GGVGMDCRNTPFFEEVQISSIASRDLPLSGEAQFTNVPRGEMWMVRLVGYTPTGAPVAFGCQDFVAVEDGEVTRTSVMGQNRPLVVAGDYESDLTFDFELPTDVLSVLTALDVTCAIINLGGACDLVSGLSTTLSDLDVRARWTLDARDSSVTGLMEWTEVEGVDVKGQYDLVTGGFRGRIVGTDDLEISSDDLSVNMDEVLRFVLVEVLEADVNSSMINVIVDATDTLTTDLMMSAADASLTDNDFDLIVDRFNGTFDVAIELPQLEQARELEVSWSAERVVEDERQ